ncbi:hypothetical protein DDP54_09840 [Cellulomonas sp. WB94]|uniref:hypothetical protein n=1 Tax=Cellulomonas sp. WB94 TaxID=2173174 RepID=UPI000D576A7E|nr:hypothetical protein [Cellulomonas sp. WB94]PVU83242.1 hypothetical protein DDP54_09840 [Cellulomonas sp. WB94]
MSDDDYMGVPTSIQLEIGKVVVVGTRLEDLAYRISEGALGFPDARKPSATQALDRIKDDVRAKGVPPWSLGRASALAIDGWVSTAKSALNERHRIAHSTHYRIRRHDRWVDEFKRNDGKEVGRVTKLAGVVRTRRALERAYKEGLDIQASLSPQIKPGVHVILWGPDAGSTLVNGDVATAATAEETAAWELSFNAVFGHLLTTDHHGNTADTSTGTPAAAT